uniref:Uncharacterized protein n=1 Tax=Mola mola TaxID=94237 RepID=A0A3Q3W0D0_MOLML
TVMMLQLIMCHSHYKHPFFKASVSSVWLVMATTSIGAIQGKMLARGHKFILMSKFTQDCLLNTFSWVRYRKHVPTPIEFNHAAKQH